MGNFDFTYSYNLTGIPEIDEANRQLLLRQRKLDGRDDIPVLPIQRIEQNQAKGADDGLEVRNGKLQAAPRAGQAQNRRNQAGFNGGFGMWDEGMMGAFGMANAASNMQGNYLQQMADRATANIANENASRVAQAREERRMQHERDLMAMRTSGNQSAEIAQLRQLIVELRAELARAKAGPRTIQPGQVLQTITNGRVEMG